VYLYSAIWIHYNTQTAKPYGLPDKHGPLNGRTAILSEYAPKCISLLISLASLYL